MDMHVVFINDYYIGLNDKDTEKQEHSTEELKKRIAEVLDVYEVDSYTLIECEGYYLGMSENTFILRLIGEPLEDIILAEILNKLNQESILHTRQKVEAKLY